MTANLKKLAIDHARLADEVSRLRAQSRELWCKGPEWRSIPAPGSCLSRAYEETGDANIQAGPFDGYSFEEIYRILLDEGKICENCQKLRELKKQRTKARVHLGAIRGAITRIGRRLQKESVPGAEFGERVYGEEVPND